MPPKSHTKRDRIRGSFRRSLTSVARGLGYFFGSKESGGSGEGGEGEVDAERDRYTLGEKLSRGHSANVYVRPNSRFPRSLLSPTSPTQSSILHFVSYY